MATSEQDIRKQIRILLIIFITGLVISGLTAFPIECELAAAHVWFPSNDTEFPRWINNVYTGVRETNSHYPFIAYGTDWLAFAHLILAILFIGPLRDPVKNIWVMQFGLIACIGIFPLALVAGHMRGIPFFWQCIDCSFGFFGGIVMALCLRKTTQLANIYGVTGR